MKMYLQDIGDFFSNVPKEALREVVRDCVRRLRELDRDGVYF